MAEVVNIKVNTDTKQSVKSLGELNDELEKTSNSAEELDKSLEDTGGKGGIFDSLKEGLGELGGQFGDVAGAAGGLGQSLLALATNPVVAVIALIVGALKLVVDRMKETTDGTATLNGIMASFKAVLNPILDLLTDLVSFVFPVLQVALEAVSFVIEILINYWKNIFDLIASGIQYVVDLATSFDFVNSFIESTIEVLGWVGDAIMDFLKMLGLLDDEYENAAEQANKYAQALVYLEEAKKQNEAQDAKDLKRIEELKILRDDELQTIDDRIAANEEIQKVETERINRTIALAEREIEIRKGQLALDEDNIELKEQLADAEKELADAQAQSAGIVAEATQNRNNLIREELDLLRTRKEGETAYLEAVEANEQRIYNSRRSSINAQLQLLRDRGATELAEYKDLVNQLKILDAERLTALKNRTIEAEEAIRDIRNDAIEDEFRQREAVAKTEFDRFKKELEAKGQLTDAENQLLIEKEMELQRTLTEIRTDEETFNEEQRRLKEQAELQREILVSETKKTNVEIKKSRLQFQMEAELEEAESLEERNAIYKKYTDERKDLLEQQYNAEKELLGDQTDAALEQANSNEEKLKIEADYYKNLLELKQKYKKDSDKIDDEIEEEQKTRLEELSEEISKVAQEVANQVSKLTNATFDILNSVRENENARREEAYNEDLAQFENLLLNKNINERQYDAEIKKLEERRRQEQRREDRKAFNVNKTASIVDASIQTATAALGAFANGVSLGGPILGGIYAAIAAAFGASQIALIASERNPYAQGGYVSGPGSGTSDSIPASLSNGESVMTARTTDSYYNLLSMMNESMGGKSLPGAPSVSTKVSKPINTANPYSRTEVVLSENEVSRVQKRVDVIENDSSF